MKRRSRTGFDLLSLALALFVSALATSPILATTIVVDTTADDVTVNGNCTLREAIQAANGNSAVDGCAAGDAIADLISIPAGAYILTLTGSGEDLDATGDLDIRADFPGTLTISGATAVTTFVDAGGIDRVFHVVHNMTVTFQNLTITNGLVAGPGNNGGGIAVPAGGTITLDKVGLSANLADNGGGIEFAGPGTLSVLRSTFESNTAIQDGGSIRSSGTLDLRNVTIYGGDANRYAAFDSSGSTTLNNCTISVANSATATHMSGTPTISNSMIMTTGVPPCTSMTDAGFNLFTAPGGCSGVNALGNSILIDNYATGVISPVDNGGGIRTCQLVWGSAALDAGSRSAGCESTDARGISRSGAGWACDIGAYEETAPSTCGSGRETYIEAPGTFRMMSLPCNTGATMVGSLFNDNLPGVYGADYAFWKRDAALNIYTQLLATDTVVPGEGLWFRTNSYPGTPPYRLDIVGSSVVAATTLVPLVDDVAGRYNLVGFPYDGPIDWPSVQVRYSATDHSLSVADSAGVMSKVMYKWNGAAYQAYDPDIPTQTGILYAWDSFWVKVFGPGPVELNIPQPAMAIPKPGRPTGDGASSSGRSFGANEWGVRLTASSGKLVDPGNLFGRLEGAEVGFDRTDLPELPPPTTPYLTVVFPHPDWGGQAGDYTTDFQPVGGLKSDRWDFEVRSSIQDRPITLTWSGPADVVGCSVLVDLESGELVDTGSTSSYRFSPTGESRPFRWSFAPSAGDARRVRPKDSVR